MAADESNQRQDWAWLNRALFGVEAGFVGGGRSLWPGAQDTKRWAVLPNTSAPRRLVPGERRAAAASFANVHDGMGDTRRRVGRATQRAVGLGAPLGASGTATLPERLGVGGDSGDSVLADLAGRLGVDASGHVAITLGPRRYNRKPVVQLIDASGHTQAFIKIACDEVTDRFVVTEAQWLERAAATHGHTFAALRPPEVLDDWEWKGRRVLAVAPIHPDQHRPDLLDADRLRSLANDIASIGPTVETTLADAASIDRVTAAAAAAHDDALIAATESVVSTWGDVAVTVGPWHGDLTPWNTISTTSHTALLDWEFAADAMPVGADLIHHHVMVDTHLRDVSIDAALRAVRQRLPELLDGFANRTATDGLFAVYLLELARRDAHLVAHNAPTTGFGSAALAIISESVAA